MLNLPQWNTAFTSRLSDKNKSGFLLRAYKSDTANENSIKNDSTSGFGNARLYKSYLITFLSSNTSVIVLFESTETTTCTSIYLMQTDQINNFKTATAKIK